MGEKRTEADVSVVIPVKDCAPYLAQCLDSVLGQTQAPRQIVCADDGSKDGSLEILEDYASRDGRIEVLELPGVGPGVARNACLDRAVGRYVAFLDADDFMEPALVEQAFAQAEADGSDVVAWDIWFYNDRFQHRQHPTDGVLAFGRLDEGRPFSWRQGPDWIFLAFQSWVWNKLFRRDFLVEEGIRFQEIRRSEDVLFTCTALVAAKKISCLYDRLTNYRVAREGSAMATKDRHSLDFLDAFEALRAEIVRRGLWDELRRAYVSFASSSCLYNLQTLCELDSSRRVFENLASGGFERIGVDLSRAEDFVDESCLAECRTICESPFESYLFGRAKALDRAREDAVAVCDHTAMDGKEALERKDAELAARDAELAAKDELASRLEADLERGREEAAGLRERIAQLEGTIDEITHCAEWRVGTALGKIPRAIQRKVLARRAAKNGE